MTKGGNRFTYRAVDPQPDLPPRRAWLSRNWKRPGPPRIPARIQFGPDYAAHLPVWGVDWQNPPFSMELLHALFDMARHIRRSRQRGMARSRVGGVAVRGAEIAATGSA